MISIDPKYENFLNNLSVEVRLNWSNKAYALAKKAGISQGNLSKILNRKIIAEYPTRIKIADAVGIKYEVLAEIETCQKEIKEDVPVHEPPPNVVNYQSAKNKEHHDAIDKFQDQETALEINNILVKIESLDPESLGEIKAMLHGKLTAMEKRHRKDTPEPGRPGERPGKRA